MKLLKSLLKSLFAIIIVMSVSCNKHEVRTISFGNVDVVPYLFNVPYSKDTLFIDKDYNMDIRMEIEGQNIESIQITIDDYNVIQLNSSIINTESFYKTEGLHSVSFLIRSVNKDNGDIGWYQSKEMFLYVVENLSNTYVTSSVENGRLKLTWPALDKKHTSKYLVERFMGENMEYSQTFESPDSVYIDNFYVGEKANFKISAIDHNGEKLDCWYFKKALEIPSRSITQNATGGYDIHFGKCLYYNNFKEYYVTTGMNNNPELLFSSTQIGDTVFHVSDVKFADEGRYWIRYLPASYPQGVTETDWMLYGKFMYFIFGESNFVYDRIEIVNSDYFVYTIDGKIFKRNHYTGQVVDSIVNKDVRYGFLNTTPGGNYMYVVDENKYGSPVYFWPTDPFLTSPTHTFHTDFTVPPVSDNLIAIMSIPSNVVPSKLALYDVTNGSRIFTTPYDATGNGPRISSSGEYMFINGTRLRLCSYKNNIFSLIWEESDWTKYYRLYEFNPLNDAICYTWDDEKKFTIRSTADYSEMYSYTLNLDAVINIDYYSKRIMGYVTDKIVICNLINGTIEKEIPANLSELFAYSNNAILIGNTIYSNQGIKYTIF